MKLFTALVVSAALVTSGAAHSRARANNQPSRLFTDSSVVTLRLEAPLERLFATARAAGASADASVEGRLFYADPATGRETILGRVQVSVRGNSSRRDSECSFPKLKLDFDNPPADSPFAGMKTVKIGTHCGERPDGQLTRLGRWANEKSPFREALVYRLVDAAGVPTLKTRPARVTYVDGATQLDRAALLLEDEGAAGERLGATGEAKNFENARASFSLDDAAAVAFVQAMIGNFDWAVKFSPGDYYRNDDTQKLWNVLAFRRDDGGAFPFVYDFDLAGPVVGGLHPWFAKVYFDGFESRSAVAIEVLGQVQRTRTLFERRLLDRTRQRFVSAKPAIYRALDGGPVDDEGRRVAREYLDRFFEEIGSDDRFYRPVVLKRVPLFADQQAARPACGAGDLVPAGTVVSEPLAQDDRRVQVNLVDVWWHWASRCDAVHRGPVWVQKNAIGRDYPDGEAKSPAARRPF